MNASFVKRAIASSLVFFAATTTVSATETMKDWENTLRNKIVSAHAYPRAALKDGIEGTVKIRLQFAGDGGVEGVQIVETSGHKLLDKNALQLALHLKDIPALPKGNKKMSLVIPLTFKIAEKG